MTKPIPRSRIKCLSCEREFDVHAYRAHKARYCSRECYREHRFRDAADCPACGKKAPPGQRFCGADCRRDYWAEREPERYQKRSAGYRAKQREIIATLGGRCIRCGNNDPRVLEIDHIDGAKKLRPPHRFYSTPVRVNLWAREMGNLQVLCANCHRIKTWEDRQR
jgi:5-methylcytosine-specific restriction endonuclease McrA